MSDRWLDQALLTPPPPGKKKRKKPENKVQRAVVVWLLGRGCVVAVTDAGVLSKMGLRMSCGIPRGWPDITACLPSGRFLGVECKSTHGRQSAEQKKQQARIEQNGGVYVLARSVSQLVFGLKKAELCGLHTGLDLTN